MDKQNIFEKIGIVRELGDIKAELVGVRAELTALKEVKTQMHREITESLNGVRSDVYGNGHEGIKTVVDRLNEKEKTRRTHYMVFYGATIAGAVKMVFDWMHK